jgi:Arc/MetJ-type ribon-helix-helix transcriptional regulator
MHEQSPLRPEDEDFIAQALQTGRYASREEILSEGLPHVRRRVAAWARFEREMRKAADSLDRGEGIPVEQAFDELDEYIDGLTKRRERKDAA